MEINNTLTEEEEKEVKLYLLRATAENIALANLKGRDLTLGMPTYTSTNPAGIARAQRIAQELGGVEPATLKVGTRKAISAGM
jgi:hypothetical protein